MGLELRQDQAADSALDRVRAASGKVLERTLASALEVDRAREDLAAQALPLASDLETPEVVPAQVALDSHLRAVVSARVRASDSAALLPLLQALRFPSVVTQRAEETLASLSVVVAFLPRPLLEVLHLVVGSVRLRLASGLEIAVAADLLLQAPQEVASRSAIRTLALRVLFRLAGPVALLLRPDSALVLPQAEVVSDQDFRLATKAQVLLHRLGVSLAPQALAHPTRQEGPLDSRPLVIHLLVLLLGALDHSVPHLNRFQSHLLPTIRTERYRSLNTKYRRQRLRLKSPASQLPSIQQQLVPW